MAISRRGGDRLQKKMKMSRMIGMLSNSTSSRIQDAWGIRLPQVRIRVGIMESAGARADRFGCDDAESVPPYPRLHPVRYHGREAASHRCGVLQPVYRILSFAATGGLLIVA